MKRQHQFHSLPLLAIIGFFACTSSVWADSNAPTCSDMSEHARVLDAGMKLYNDHARLNAEQGRIPEAVTLYEQALAHFRNLPTKGEAYGLLLQSYGDMLAHANQQKKADQIYDEARIFYARSSSELAN